MRMDQYVSVWLFDTFGLAPSYITEMLTLHQSNRALRSTNISSDDDRYYIFG